MSGFVKNEVLRIWGDYKLWLLLFAMLSFNICVLLAYFSIDEINPDVYKQVKYNVIEQPDLFIDEYMENMDSPVYERLYREYASVSEYSAYVDSVMESVKNDSQISIFQNEFSRNNFKKTGEDYGKLRDIYPVFVGSYGLERAVSFYGTDILVFLIIIIVVNIIFIQDKKTGMLSLIKASKYGDGRLALAKILSMTLYVTAFGLLVLISNIILATILYGSVSFNVPIQSMLEYMYTGMNISIGAFLVRMIFHKLLIYFFVTVAVVLLAVFSSNEILLYVGITVISMAELFIYSVGKAVRLVLLYHISIPHMLNLKEFYGYYNYNLFNYPVNAVCVDIIILASFCIICLWIYIYAFSKCSLEYRSISIYRRKRGRKRLYGLAHIDVQKLMLGYRVIVVVAALVLLQLLTYVGNHARWPANELYYRNYMKQIEGKITDEKLDYIRAEQRRLEKLRIEYDGLYEEYNAGMITYMEYEKRSDTLSAELIKEVGLERCIRYVDYIMSLDEPELEFVYDRGWNYLFGAQAYKYDIKNAAILVIAVLLGVAFMYAEEYKYNMHVLTEIGANYKKLKIIKAFIVFFYILAVFLMVYLPELIWVYKEFGLTNKDASVVSLMRMSGMPGSISIMEYCIMVYLVRFITICIISGLIICLCKCIKNTNKLIIISAIIFLIPLLLNMLGINAFDKYTCNMFLSGNMMFRSMFLTKS